MKRLAHIALPPYIQSPEIRARDYVPSYHPRYQPRTDHYVPVSGQHPPPRVPVTHLVQSTEKLADARAKGAAKKLGRPLKPTGPVANLLQALAEHPNGIEPEKLAAAASISSRNIGPYLKTHMKSGRVVRDAASGLWRLTRVWDCA